MLTTETLFRISKEVGASVSRVEATVSLLEGGATIPFIARYRKEATGNLDEVKIQDIDECRTYYTELDQRRATILASIERQGKLSEELKQKIQGCFSKNELEDLYLPHKPKKKTKAATALAMGLGPLAEYIWEQTGTDPVGVYAERFLSPPEPEPAASEAGPAEAATEGIEPSVEAAASPAETAPAAAEAGPAEAATEGIDSSVEAAASPAETAPAAAEAGAAEAATEGIDSSAEAAAPPAETAPAAAEAGAAEAATEGIEPSVEAAASPAETAPAAAEAGTAEAATEGIDTSAEAAAPPAETAPAAAPPPPVSQKPSPKRRINTVQEAIEGALHILAERIAENPESRKYLRDKLMLEGIVRAHVVPGRDSEKTKYEMYYKFEETVPKIPSHRMLAIRRGTRENVLTYTIETDSEKFLAWLLPQVIRDSNSQFAPFLDRAVRDSYERLMLPSIRNEARAALRERSESEAIKVFEENLGTLLLAPPAGPIGTIGVDPGIRTGCKVAVVDETGTFLESQVLQLSDPGKDLESAEKALVDLVTKYNVRAITIGNGTASRETEAFVRGVVQKNGWEVFVVVVSEAGASVYSASKRAREEFPKLDVTVRGAISIARRLAGSACRTCKDRASFDRSWPVPARRRSEKVEHSLEGAVASCVNRVGVDLNTASQDLLKYVSGINDKLAGSIIAHRTQSGAFRSRVQLRDIEGFGDKHSSRRQVFCGSRMATTPWTAPPCIRSRTPLLKKLLLP